MRALMAVTIALLAYGTPAHADVNIGQILPKVPPGGELTIVGANLQEKKTGEYRVVLRGTAEHQLAVERVEPTMLVVRIPGQVSAGPYLLHVTTEGGPEQFVGQLDVVASAPQIHRVAVISGWMKLLWNGQFDFRIVGERLCVDKVRTHASCATDRVPASRAGAPAGAADTVDLFLGVTHIPLQRCAETNGGTIPARPVTTPCYAAETPQALAIHGLDVSEHGGAKALAVQVGGLRSNSEHLRVSRITPRMIKWLSLALLVVLLAPLAAIGTRIGSASAGKRRSSLLTWALLDAETNTYSLSKFQLLLWTVAVVYGYVYLLLALVFVQGQLALPPFPSHLSVLLGGAGATSLASSVLSRSRGPKGAGGSVPTISDLLSSGGVLAADRAQFLIWTLISVGGFVLIVLRELPEEIQKLPEVNSELLSAMGVSAAVYVLGKSVRLPGPVIATATATAGQAAFELKIEGTNLHKDATISIDGQIVDVIRVPSTAAAGPNPVSANLVTDLTVQLSASGPWAAGDHQLRITNLDGQFADVWFAADPPAVTSAAPPTVPAGTTAVAVTLTGQHIRPGSTAEWLAPGQSTPVLFDATRVEVQAPATAVVRFEPGTTKGQGMLTLVSPRDMRATQTITVE